MNTQIPHAERKGLRDNDDQTLTTTMTIPRALEAEIWGVSQGLSARHADDTGRSSRMNSIGDSDEEGAVGRRSAGRSTAH